MTLASGYLTGCYGSHGPFIDVKHDELPNSNKVSLQRYIEIPEGNHSSLVCGSTPLKNMKVSWDDYSEYMEKYSKPPTRNSMNQCSAGFGYSDQEPQLVVMFSHYFMH